MKKYKSLIYKSGLYDLHGLIIFILLPPDKSWCATFIFSRLSTSSTLFVRLVERDKRRLWKPPPSTTWSQAGDCEPSKRGGWTGSRSRSHVDRYEWYLATTRHSLTFFSSCSSNKRTKLQSREKESLFRPLSLYLVFLVFSSYDAIYGVERSHRALLSLGEIECAISPLGITSASLWIPSEERRGGGNFLSAEKGAAR